MDVSIPWTHADLDQGLIVDLILSLALQLRTSRSSLGVQHLGETSEI